MLLLKGLADTPRIAGGDYGDVIRELRKVGYNRLLLNEIERRSMDGRKC